MAIPLPVTPPSVPPQKLGEAGLSLWTRVQDEFRVEDCGGIELLVQACLMVDRATELAAAIAQDGCMVSTASGMKVHPAVREELAARSFVTRTLMRLGVVYEPVKGIGRPPGHPPKGFRGVD
jgi:hypothetical protein